INSLQITGTPIAGQRLYISIFATANITISVGNIMFHNYSIALPTSLTQNNRLAFELIHDYYANRWVITYCSLYPNVIDPTAFAGASHTHTIANVTGLQTALDDKAS